MGSARAIFLEQIRKADKHNRFRLYTPVTDNENDIYVHAKVMVVDDVLLRVGSSNLNNRSMGLDTECDLAIEARDDGEGERRKSITDIRNQLVSEHLGVTPDVLVDALSASHGRLTGAIDALRRDKGRSMRLFEPEQLNVGEKLIAESELLNSDRPEDMSDVFLRQLEALSSTGKAGLAAGALAGAGLSWLLWRRFRRSPQR